jgi:hypothetical protein
MERASSERDGGEVVTAETLRRAESGERTSRGPRSGLLGVQSSAGNAATIALLQRRGLEVGAADDPAEREADAVAAEVMTALRADHEAESETPHAPGGAVQRRATTDLSGAPGHGPAGGQADPQVAGAIEAQRGHGNSLPSSVRAPIETAMGADLGGVRIHADAQADRLNRSLNAEAFTTGSDIFFRKGAYQPGTTAGTELLSHELAHVVQQSGGARRKLRRSLVRDRVFSDVEFLKGVGGQTEGGQFAVIVAQLKKLEGLHDSLANSLAKIKGDDTFEQRFSGKQNNMKHLVKTADEIVQGIPHVVANADRYIAEHEDSTSGVGGKVKGLFTRKKTKQAKIGRVEQVQTLLIQLHRRREQLRAQAEQWRFDLLTMKKAQIQAEMEAKSQKSSAMDEARHGTFGMYKGRVNDAKFGAGAMGSVAQVDYKDEKGKTFKGVFKAEPEQLPDNDGGISGLGVSKETPNLSLRAVAASRLNELLGMKVIPKTELAFHEQFGFGQVMALAGGKSPQTKVKVELEEADEEKIKKIEEVLKIEERKYGPMSKVVRSKDTSGKVQAFIEETVTFETDWDHPILKRELANLQLMDALIGNIDRHCENYFIQVDAFGNPVGVLGIDNDLTFARDKNDPTEVAFMQGHHAGLPPAVDANAAEKFCSVTEAQVRKAVAGLLNKIEIDTLVVRLKSIQAKLSEMKDGEYVIPRIGNDLEGAKQWTELKDPAKTKGAYFARERKWQQGGMKEIGRLLKPNQALLYKENRLAQLIKQVEAKQGG